MGNRVINMAVEYAVYKGDKFIDQGTADYLADRLGVKRATIIWLQSPTNLKRDKGNRMVAVKVD